MTSNFPLPILPLFLLRLLLLLHTPAVRGKPLQGKRSVLVLVCVADPPPKNASLPRRGHPRHLQRHVVAGTRQVLCARHAGLTAVPVIQG